MFYYGATSDKFILVPSQPIYSICLHLTSILTSVIWAFFQQAANWQLQKKRETFEMQN